MIITELVFFRVLGMIIANSMALVTIQMKSLAEKRQELSQTIALLLGSIRTNVMGYPRARI